MFPRMLQMLSNINNFWNDYPVDFFILVFGLIISLIAYLNMLLPTRYQLNKRINFLRKISKTVCSIKVSIPCRRNILFSELKDIFSNYWNKNTANVEFANATINFNSLDTGSNYKIRLVESDDENKSIVTVENFNGFTISTLGSLKHFDDAIDEVQQIVDKITKEKDLTENVNILIALIPRKGDKLKENLCANGKDKYLSYSYSYTKINLISKGFSKLKKNTTNLFYEWMSNFV